MVYGEEKARDMARSLLPSRGRKSARRHRAGVHREARRTARLEVARFARDPEAFDGVPAPEGTSDPEIRQMVRERRWADKVNPFIRWATAITRALPRESRLSHVQGLLPKGVIGEHALSHLKSAAAFEDPNEREWWKLRSGLMRQWQGRDRGEQAELLRAVIAAPGGHRAFNRWLQARHATRYHAQGVPMDPTRARPLRGLHDVLPFLDEVGKYAPGWYRGKKVWQPRYERAEWFRAMEDFLHAFKQCRGNVKDTLATLGLKEGK